jgi:soluble lytic murein transglycosylase
MMPRSIILAAIGCGLLGGLPSSSRSADVSVDNRPATELSSIGPSSIDNALISQQRDIFRQIYAGVELGNWDKAEQHEDLLSTYVLWPDLQAAFLRTRLGDVDDSRVRDFLDRYGTLKPARELRYRYALFLAQENRLPEYFEIYQQFYQGLQLPKLDCLALQAEMLEGRHNRIVNRAKALWLVGQSQEEECEPVFDDLRNRDLINEEHYAKRYELAIETQRFSLAKYLARSLDAVYLAQADAWLSAQNNPEKFLDAATDLDDNGLSRKQLTYAIGRIAFNKPLLAQDYWSALAEKFSFSTRQDNEVRRHIALWAAREHLAEARDLLEALPAAAVDTEASRWLVRANLSYRDWNGALQSIAMLPDAESTEPEWQFWKAVSLQQTGDETTSRVMLEKLARERSYYGFLAADVISAPYAFDHLPTVDDGSLEAELLSHPALLRARELFLVGLDSRGRSEWDAATRGMDRDRKLQAAILADRWGWHSRAISTIANAGNFDDLIIRYPLPWLEDFEQHSKTANISHSWAYGIARSESLFMRDVKSSAGAIGLMQLMPATGRETAREINLRYGGLITLTNSSSNIRLGTAYLSKMYNRFAGNRALATAAYNAGPHRVEKWLPQGDKLDARIWIENIPFRETRNYVRRVLTDEAIFHWRLTGEHQRISSGLPLIGRTSDTERLTSASAN